MQAPASAQRGNPQKVPAGLALVGAALLLLSLFLEWITLGEAGEVLSFNGLDLDVGLLELLVGAIILVLGVILMVKGSKGGGKGLAVGIVVLASIGLLGALYAAFDPGGLVASEASRNIAETEGIPEQEAAIEAEIQSQLAAGTIEVGSSIGTYAAVVSSLLALVGGILGIRAARQVAGPGVTGYGAPGGYGPPAGQGPPPGPGGYGPPPSAPGGSGAPQQPGQGGYAPPPGQGGYGPPPGGSG